MRISLLTVALLFPSTAWAAGPEEIQFFEAKVRPLLLKSCHECHGAKKQSGGLRLDTAAGFRDGSDSGPLIDPKNPDKSLLLRAIRHEGPKMPKTKLSAEKIATLTRWVKMGAPWPGEAKGQRPRGAITTADRAYWAFQPVKFQPPPKVANPAWVKSPIDAFILAGLEKKGLTPANPASRRVLFRRLHYDLLGLPPSPAEIDDFVNDDRPDAYERLVDRLLASPGYGERWGRHWLDVVRYADTAGDNSDYPIPQAYKYRNWVLTSRNADQPYDEFLQHQIAGDLLPGKNERETYDRIIATGYLANARRFGSYEDKRYQWYLTYEDTIENLGRTVLGLGLSCSRCHDHKFDPVFQDDYYALYGIFRSTRYPWPGIELDKRQHDMVPIGKETAYAMAEGKRWVGSAKIHLGGDPMREGKEAPRRFLRILGGQPLPSGEKGSGRLHLAQWLSSKSNPLTARVLVNRLWLHHFGQGIVPTPNDFGRQGRPPTHPELLDYLAARLVESGWSWKSMHRLMVLSNTYQMASADDKEKSLKDPSNELLWRANPRRLDAEAIRDTLLVLGQALDGSKGESHPFPPMDKWDFTQHKPFEAVYETNRRSVYLMTQRIKRHPFLALFDGADTNASTGSRAASTTALQALYLMNDPFVLRMARGFGRRLETLPDNSHRLDEAFQLAFGRLPSEQDKNAAASALEKMRGKLQKAGLPQKDLEHRLWESFARSVLLSNELVYLD
jgi:hypothetical protein